MAGGGLTIGAKAGIAVAIAVLVVLVVSLCICLHISYRNKRLKPYRKDKTFQTTYPGQIPYAFQNNNKGQVEGRAPLLRDGSDMDVSMRTGSSVSAQSSPYLGSPNIGGYSPGGMETLSPPGRDDFKQTRSGGSNNGYLSPNFLSPASPNLESKLEKERWRESHSIAGYFENQQAEAEPRLSTGDKMVAEWRKAEIENARERSRSRSREPHPMADYQMALPPFFPKGFKDINGEGEEGKRRSLKAEAERLLKPEIHEMDVGDAGRGRGHDR
jgi:hypothetical protein